MQRFTLNASEEEALFRQDPTKKKDGGWQSLLVGLQENYSSDKKEIIVSIDQARRIPTYAFDYGNGGWEGRLTTIFARHLGPKLGR